MILGLVLKPSDAAPLTRLATDDAPRGVRRHARAERTTWHDDADFSLAASDRVLIAEAGQWRLEPLHPTPNVPPRVSTTMAGLGLVLPRTVAAIATLTARRSVLRMQTRQGAVTVTLRRGVLQAGPTRQPVLRADLDGAEAAVELAALAIFGRTHASVAPHSLSLHALRAAGATLPLLWMSDAAVPPPGDMPVSIADAFSVIIGRLTCTLLQVAPDAIAHPERPVPVHQMRVAVRRARSAVAVFHAALACPAIDALDTGLRTLGKALAPARDWDVFATETLPAVAAAFPDDNRLTRLQRAAEQQRQRHHTALADYLGGQAFRALTVQATMIAEAHHWRDSLNAPAAAEQPLRAFADTIMRKRWKRLLAAGDGMESHPVEALHDLRLQAKRARYAAEMFAPLYPAKPVSRHIKRLARLQEELGVLNDRVVAAALLQSLEGGAARHGFASGAVLGFGAGAAVSARKRIEKAWHECRRGDAFWR